MGRNKSTEEISRKNQLLGNLVGFLVCWLVLLALMAIIRNFLPPGFKPQFLLRSYVLAYVSLSVLAVGLVLVIGVLPGSRFSAPESKGLSTKKEVDAVWDAVAEGMKRLYPPAPPEPAPAGNPEQVR